MWTQILVSPSLPPVDVQLSKETYIRDYALYRYAVIIGIKVRYLVIITSRKD
jgi:hypothetical protein